MEQPPGRRGAVEKPCFVSDGFVGAVREPPLRLEKQPPLPPLTGG